MFWALFDQSSGSRKHIRVSDCYNIIVSLVQLCAFVGLHYSNWTVMNGMEGCETVKFVLHILPQAWRKQTACLQFCNAAWMTQSIYSDSLRAERSGDQIAFVGARFSAPVRTGCEAHPATYIRGTGSFLGLNWSERDVDHPCTSSAEVKERVALYLYCTSGPSWPVIGGGSLPLPLPFL